MPYKIYISVSDSTETAQYLAVVKQALFSINEIPIAAVDTQTEKTETRSLAASRNLIDQSDLFIGLYGATYGAIPDGDRFSIAEQEYQYAVNHNKSIIIFVPDDVQTTADEQQQLFLQHIMERHIVHYFADTNALAAKVKLALASYKTSMTIQSVTTKLKPNQTMNFISRRSQESEETSAGDFEGQVNRAVQIAQDDIEQIVRRALELHAAQSQLEKDDALKGQYVEDERDGLVLARPLWGEPLRRSQFQSDIFMIMPFRERFNGVYEGVIRPTVAGLNMTMKRGDDFSSTRGSIMAEVWAAIYACKLVIVETTEVNANVYYELGIAHTLGKPAILLTQTTEVQQLPFDIRHLRFLVYDDSVAGLEKLEQDLRKSIVWIMNDLREQDGES